MTILLVAQSRAVTCRLGLQLKWLAIRGGSNGDCCEGGAYAAAGFSQGHKVLEFGAASEYLESVSYTHLTLPTT
jgi:hypothetical protein